MKKENSPLMKNVNPFDPDAYVKEAVRYTRYLKRKYFYLGFIAGGLTVWLVIIALALITT